MSLLLCGVERRFGRRVVLQGLDLEVSDGDRVALLGSNGSGKTTLLRILAGTLRPTEGRVEHQGLDPLSPAGRRGMAFVPHDAAVYPELTVQEHLTWWARVHRTQPDADRLLQDAGLARLAHHLAGELSRGQRQRLALCMALATNARTYLLDEPTTALDDDGVAWLARRLQALDATLVLATHDPAFAETLGARTLRLQGGRFA